MSLKELSWQNPAVFTLASLPTGTAPSVPLREHFAQNWCISWLKSSLSCMWNYETKRNAAASEFLDVSHFLVMGTLYWLSCLLGTEIPATQSSHPVHTRVCTYVHAQKHTHTGNVLVINEKMEGTALGSFLGCWKYSISWLEFVLHTSLAKTHWMVDL